MRSGLGGGGASRLREGAARWYRPASLAIALHILIPLVAHVARPLRAAPTDAPGHLTGDEQLSVQLKGSSDDVAWRRAVRALKQRLSASSFPLPASLPQGATVYIDVTSTFAHPSGGKEVAKLDDAAPIVAYTERKPQDGTSNAGDLFSSAPEVGLGATLIFEGDASNLATNKRRRLRSRVRLIAGL